MSIFRVVIMMGVILISYSVEAYPMSCDIKAKSVDRNGWLSWELDACSELSDKNEQKACASKYSSKEYVPAGDDTGADAQKFYCQSSDLASVAKCSLVILKAVACNDQGTVLVPSKCASLQNSEDQISCAVKYLTQWQEESI